LTLVIAHRGASGYAPENTFASFEKALELNSDGIELDVHMTRDNQLVVIHDFTLKRTTGEKGCIKDFDYSDIKKLDAGSWFSDEYKHQKIPKLKKVLEFLQTEDILINIEIKAGSRFYPYLEEKLLEEISRISVKGKFLISSFDHHGIKRLKSLDPKIKTGVLSESSMIDPCRYSKEFVGADAYHPHYKTVDKVLIEESLKHHMPLNVYTVNRRSDAKKLAVLNVNSIITNFPDKIMEILKGFSL